MAGALLFWTPMALFQSTAMYASTFVAQYLGAGRPHRTGAAVWQALYFSLFAGLAFPALYPLFAAVVRWGDNSATMQEHQLTYIWCLGFSALPGLLVAASSSFFTGRGESSKVLLINAVGLSVNALLDVLLINGYWGFPRWGIAGAGWATVVGNCVSAVLGLVLLFGRQYREQFATLSAWAFDRALFGRLMLYGLPSGFHWALDAFAFALFTQLIGKLGDAELSASSIAFTMNLVAFLPPFGLVQAVAVLVGQRLGENNPDIAERTTWTGFRITWLYMAIIALVYLAIALGIHLAYQDADPTLKTNQVAQILPGLLIFIAVYSLFDSMNLVFSSALKGAGDTWFVTIASVTMAWLLMVVPCWLAVEYGLGLWWCWAAASAFIILVAFVFLWRFLGGKWKSMRVIEAAPPEELVDVPQNV